MKKTKILTVLGVLLAMGITACGGKTTPAGGSSSNGGGASGGSGGGGSNPPAPVVEPINAHQWGEDEDIDGDELRSTADFKVAECSDTPADNVVRIKVNQDQVKYSQGSSRKSGTPEGYTKLTGDNQSLYFQFNSDATYRAKLYLFGRMDGWSTDANQSAGFYRNGTESMKVEVNDVKIDTTAQKNKSFLDYFGPHDNETTMSSPSNHLSDEGYAPVGDTIIYKGVNVVKYSRLQTQNMIIKDFVFVATPVSEAEEWGTGTPVAAATGSIAYTKYTSQLNDGRVKLEWAGVDGTWVQGANKTGTGAPKTGYMKAGTNGDNISYAFNYDADLDGIIYQYGYMDNYASNDYRTFFSVNTASNAYGNFELKFNGSNVYFGDKRNVKYSDMLGDKSLADSDNNSPDGLCEVGEAYVKNGANTMNFKRVDSFNLSIKNFVFIGKAVAAAHTAPADDADYAGQDDYSHWQKAAATTDAFKYNRGEHRWIDDPDETDVPATCTAKGTHYKKCSVCGKKVSEQVDMLPHTYEADTSKDDIPATETAEGTHYVKCSVCGHESSEPIPKTGHTFTTGETTGDITALECSGCHEVGMQFNGMANNTIGDNSGALSSGKLNKAITMTWTLTMPKSGTVTVAINAKYSAGNGDKAFTSGWAIKGGASADALQNGNLTLDVTARADSLLEQNNYKYFEVGNVQVAAAGTFVIAVTTYSNSSPARLLSDGLVRVYY